MTAASADSSERSSRSEQHIGSTVNGTLGKFVLEKASITNLRKHPLQEPGPHEEGR